MLDNIDGMFLQTIMGIVLMGIGVLYMILGCIEKIKNRKPKEEPHQKLNEEKVKDEEKGKTPIEEAKK